MLYESNLSAQIFLIQVFSSSYYKLTHIIILIYTHSLHIVLLSLLVYNYHILGTYHYHLEVEANN